LLEIAAHPYWFAVEEWKSVTSRRDSALLWFDPASPQLCRQTFGALVFVLGALVFVLGALAFVLGALAFVLNALGTGA
jgi:hypothetical protein